MITFSCIFPILNGANLIGTCLRSLEPQLLADDEVIVVDNGSTDGTPDLIAREFPRVKLIRAGENLGYGGGANLGLQVMQCQAALIMNHDITLLDGCLTALRHRLELSGPAIVGCKLLYPDGQTIQHAGGIIHPPRAVADHHGYRQIDDGRWDTLSYPDYVTGAMFVIDKAVLFACGLIDDQFFPLYYEESDYCYRARRAGFPVIYEPQAVAIHHETVTYASRSAAYHRTMERSRLRFVLKNYLLEQRLDEFFRAELAFVQQVDAAFAREVCAPVYDDVLMNLPPLPPEQAVAIIESLRQLRAAARRAAAVYEVTMSTPLSPLDVPALREHEFHSNLPLVGPLVVKVRQTLYSLTAKWPLRVALDQQTRINQQLVQRLQQHEALLREYEVRLREYDERLIDQDHDLAHLSRVVAETEVRQRHLAKAISAQSTKSQL